MSGGQVVNGGSGNSGGGSGSFPSSTISFGSPAATYTGFGSGANSFPPLINGVTGAGNYPPVPATGYGYAALDIGPALFTTPPPTVVGTSSRSIMGINSAIAVALPDFINVFAINGQIAIPTSYAGNLTGGLYGMYHETDHNGTGNVHLAYSVFGADYNSGNGTATELVGGHFESIGNFYNLAVTPVTTQATALEAMSGVRAGATHTNDFTIRVRTPFTGGTFTNGHIGIQIDDQTNGGAIPIGSVYAIKVGLGGAVPSGQLDWGANTQFIESTVSGFIAIAAPNAAIGGTNVRYPQTLSAFTGTIVLSGAAINLTVQTAAISATTIATPIANGLFRITFYLKIQTAAVTSSTLGPVTLTFTDASDSTAQSVVMMLQDQTGAAMTSSSGNTTSTILTGQATIWAKSGVAIQYAVGYASNPANFMTFQLHARLEQLN